MMSLLFYLFALLLKGWETPNQKNIDLISECKVPLLTQISSTIQTGSFEYNLARPDKTWALPPQLKEISGNTWVDKDHLILIEDLNPNLYYVKIDEKNATLEKTIPFASTEKDKFDSEDVTYIQARLILVEYAEKMLGEENTSRLKMLPVDTLRNKGSTSDVTD